MRRSKGITSTVIWSICIVQILVGCAAVHEYGKLEKNARRSYQRGDYDQAVFKCAESLRLNPEYGKAQTLIQDALRAAVNTHLAKIKELRGLSAEYRWDKIVSEYEALSELNRTIESLPVLRGKKTGEIIRFELTDYSKNLTEAKTNAAEVHYQAGIDLSQKEGMDFKKQAAKEFKSALHFVPDYKDASSKYEECRKEATKRMVIIPFKDKSGKEDKYGAISEMITDEIRTGIMGDSTVAEFLKLVSREELRNVLREQNLQMSDLVDEQTAVKVGKHLGAHEILLGEIELINYSPPRATINRLKRQTQVVVSEERSKKVRKKTYKTVSATVKVYTKEANASVMGSCKLINVNTGGLVKSSSLKGEAHFKYQWATYDGDERALTSKDKELTQKGRLITFSEKELVTQAARNFSASVLQELTPYLR